VGEALAYIKHLPPVIKVPNVELWSDPVGWSFVFTYNLAHR
jgi:hypothetical protein